MSERPFQQKQTRSHQRFHPVLKDPASSPSRTRNPKIPHHGGGDTFPSSSSPFRRTKNQEAIAAVPPTWLRTGPKPDPRPPLHEPDPKIQPVPGPTRLFRVPHPLRRAGADGRTALPKEETGSCGPAARMTPRSTPVGDPKIPALEPTTKTPLPFGPEGPPLAMPWLYPPSQDDPKTISQTPGRRGASSESDAVFRQQPLHR